MATIGKTLVIIVLSFFFNRIYTLLGFRHDPNLLQEKHFEGFECNHILQGIGAEDISTTADGLAFITSGMLYPACFRDFLAKKRYPF